MGDTGIIKSGDVLFQIKSLLKVSWVKKFCVLYGGTADQHAYMALFEDKKSFKEYKEKQKKCEIKKLELQHLKSLKTSSEKKKDGQEYVIEFRINRKCHFLLFTKENEFQDWYLKLETIYGGGNDGSRENSASFGDDDDSCGENDEVITINQMYAQTDPVERYSVIVEDTPMAKLCNIVGEMTMLVGKSDIAFEDNKTRSLKYAFQLSWMRRFGKVGSTSFNFELGRKCPNGQGEVQCETSSAKEIHKLLTKKSQSNSSTVIPHSPVMKVPDKIIQLPDYAVDKEKDEPTVPMKPDKLGSTCAPVLLNVGNRHPGVAKNLPKLKQIVRQPSEDEMMPMKSHSVRANVEKDSENSKGNGHVRPSSYRSAVNNPMMAKELEEKLHVKHEEHSHDNEITKKESVKTKEDKKREKEERKERERREKEEKKEEERKHKEQEKERKQREKEAKKSGKKDKHKESDKPDVSNKGGSAILGSSSLYEEVSGGTITDDSNCIYDEASSSPTQPAEYAQSSKVRKVKSAVINEEGLYDEAVTTNDKENFKKSVYAEPYTKKGGVPLPKCDLYTDVKHVAGDAWKNAGRETEEQVFEEDYSSIKNARKQMDKKGPPPLPAKNFDNEEDDTYDSIDSTSSKALLLKIRTENPYGMASATEVGHLPDVVEPEADYRTDSDEGEEVTYDDPNYDYGDYQTPAEVQDKKVEDSYEEAVVSIKPPPTVPRKSVRRPPDVGLYEDIS